MERNPPCTDFLNSKRKGFPMRSESAVIMDLFCEFKIMLQSRFFQNGSKNINIQEKAGNVWCAMPWKKAERKH